MDEMLMSLHLYFLNRLLISTAFLIPLLIIWDMGMRYTGLKRRPKGLTYAILGFAIGFLANIIGGILGAYVCQLPLLPLKLVKAGLSPQRASHVMFIYTLAFNGFYAASLFASLILVGLGIRKLVRWAKIETD